MTVGIDARIEASRRPVLRCGLAVPIDAQDLAADEGRALGHNPVVRVPRRYIKVAVTGAEPDAPPVVRTGPTEGQVVRFGLVRDVGDDVHAAGYRGHGVVDLQPQHPVRARSREARRRIHVNEAVAREIGIDGDPLHAGLALAEQVIGGRAVALGIFHSQQLHHRPAGQPDGKAEALLGEEHRPVGQKGHIPRAVELGQHHGVRQGGNAGARRGARFFGNGGRAGNEDAG